MIPSTSFFLDWLRVTAALTVFGVHCTFLWHSPCFPAVSHLAHGAVVVFFVLSGYVIAFATWSRENTVRGYVVARLSRLSSVLIPALVLTAILQVAGHKLDPAFEPLQPRGHDLLRYLAVAAYVQSIWTFLGNPSANVPLWSLSYEFWYYALFGAAVLLKPGRARTFSVLAVLIISGPDVLLLLPCWLVGVAAYLWRERPLGGITAARAGMVVAVVAAGLVLVLVPEFPGAVGYRRWWYSNGFVGDWILAVCVGTAVLFFNAVRFPAPPRGVWNGVRWGAGHTFSLYLFHYPLLAFFTVVWHRDRPLVWQEAVAATGALGVSLVLSTFTEARRTVWRRGFARAWDALFPVAHVV